MAGNFVLDDYVQVNERVEKFYEKYPQGSIQTEIVHLKDGMVIFKAYAYRDKEDTKPCIGHAYEKEGSSFINKSSYIENCETSAVGRALAMMGFEIKKSIASREEVANAQLQQTAEATINKAKLDTIKALKIDPEIAKGILGSYGYTKSTEIKNKDFADIFETLKNCSEEATND